MSPRHSRGKPLNLRTVAQLQPWRVLATGVEPARSEEPGLGKPLRLPVPATPAPTSRGVSGAARQIPKQFSNGFEICRERLIGEGRGGELRPCGGARTRGQRTSPGTPTPAQASARLVLTQVVPHRGWRLKLLDRRSAFRPEGPPKL